MSVSIDTVYQRVLAVLNKEQRGYVTPQEFNLFANQAQMDIFEQYFYDINQFSRIPGNDTEYSDMLNILNEKINIFARTATLTYDTNHFNKPDDLYRLGTIIYNSKEVERVNKNEYLYLNSSPLTKPSDAFPIFVENELGYNVYATLQLTAGVSCNYIKKPATAEWAGVLTGGYELNDNSATINFELHPSEETQLVVKILELAGIALKDPGVYQMGNQMDAEKVQQEKA